MGKTGLKKYFQAHKQQLQVALFLIFSFAAFLSQLGSRLVFDLAFKGLDSVVTIPPFPAQALGSFLAFLISNIIAKALSYLLNRKTTFNANNGAAASIIIYIAMVVVLVIAETIIGTPLQNALYGLFGGGCSGLELTTASATDGVLYQLCGTASQAIYGLADMVIVFVMDKYVIMRHREE